MRITPGFDEHGEELTDPMRQVGAVLEASGYHLCRTALDHLRILATASSLSQDAPTSGLGETVLKENARKRVGEFFLGMRQRLGIVEASGYHPGRTGLDHLRILATASRLPHDAPERVLAETGLATAESRRVGGFSLGMRQRLGIAAAMLGDPKSLVLDEPTNGLDPPGVRWLRGYVRGLADEGRTVLLSSYALSEVELIADHVLVMAHGRLLRSSSLAALRAEAGVGSRVRTNGQQKAHGAYARGKLHGPWVWYRADGGPPQA